MMEDGLPVLAKNNSGTLTFRNQADNANLTLGNAPATHTHALAAGATDITATAAELNKLAGTPAGLTSTELGYVDGVTSAIQTQLDTKESKITTQSDVSGSRADGTVYQNTTGRALFVSVSFADDFGRLAIAYSDTNNPPTTIIAKVTGVGVNLMQIFFIVLPGNYYKVVWNNTPSTIIWFEWS